MSPMQALASGTLSAGKPADLRIVDGDPSQDVGILKQKAALELVMKSGRAIVDRR